MSVLKKFAGQTLIYGLSTIISRLLNFVLTPIFVNKFSPTVFGIFTKMYAWTAMLNAVLAFGMETTFFRYLQKVEEKDKEKVFNTTFLITILTSLLLLINVFLFLDPIAAWLNNGGAHQVDLHNDYKQFVSFFAFILVCDALAVVPFAKLRAEARPVYFGLLKLINILIFVGLNLFFIVFIPFVLANHAGLSHFFYDAFGASFLSWYKPNWVGYVFLSNLISSIVTLLMLLPQIIRFKFSLDKKLFWDMVCYSFPILIANISFIINEHVDKTLIPRLLPAGVGDKDLGIYSAVSKIAIFLSIFVQAFRLGAEPFFFSYANNVNAKKTYALIMEYFVIAMMLVMVGLSVNIEWLKYFIKGSTPEMIAEYWSGLFLVPLLLFNYVLLGIYMNLSVWYKLSDQTRYGLYISGIGALITIVFCFLLIPKYSYVGAAITTLITYMVMVTLSYFWGQRNYPIPYKVKKMIAYLLSGAAITILVYQVLDRSLIWGNLLFILYFLAIIRFEKDQILKLIKEKN